MISNADAWRHILEQLSPLPVCRVALGEARGCYLAEDLCAPFDMPPSDRSAMDGFALSGQDLERGVRRFAVRGEQAAGSGAGPSPGVAETLRLYTGAPLPSGTDTVIPVELTSVGRFGPGPQANHVDIHKAVTTGQNVFKRGETARQGDELLPAGTRMGPRQLAAAAACGWSRRRASRGSTWC